MFKPHALGLGGAIVTGAAAIICSAAYVLFPSGSVEFFSFVTHKNIAVIADEITWVKFFGGAIFWVVAAYVALFLIGWLHNKFAE